MTIKLVTTPVAGQIHTIYCRQNATLSAGAQTGSRRQRLVFAESFRLDGTPSIVNSSTLTGGENAILINRPKEQVLGNTNIEQNIDYETIELKAGYKYKVIHTPYVYLLSGFYYGLWIVESTFMNSEQKFMTVSPSSTTTKYLAPKADTIYWRQVGNAGFYFPAANLFAKGHKITIIMPNNTSAGSTSLGKCNLRRPAYEADENAIFSVNDETITYTDTTITGSTASPWQSGSVYGLDPGFVHTIFLSEYTFSYTGSPASTLKYVWLHYRHTITA